MRVVFFGTSLFAVPPLEKILKSHHVVQAVVTGPDRPQGRSLRISESPVKQIARKNQMKLFQPEVIQESRFLEELEKLETDLFIVVSYGKILSKELLEIPRLYCLNIHASLLPKYRGASPVPSALLNREESTGVTIIRMTEQVDAGDILLQKSTAIRPEDDAVTLLERLSSAGAELILEALQLAGSGKESFVPQAESEATYARRLSKEDGKIDWSRPAQELEACVRALVPWPSAYTFYRGKRLRIWRVSVNPRASYGCFGQVLKVIPSEGIEVSTGDQALLLQEVQPESRNRMPAIEFARGYRVRPGDRFER